MPLITRDNLGAWLVRCNPRVWNLEGWVDAGNEFIDDWSVRDNYRMRLMEPGDPIVFWVTGNHSHFERGIWGLGHVTDFPHDSIGVLNDDEDVDETEYWLDKVARLAVKAVVDVDIPLFLDDPVTDRQLRTAGIQDLEVQVQPQGSNPSWVSKEQLERLEGLVGGIPEYKAPARTLTESRFGAGFGDAENNHYVEEAAMLAVAASYKEAGWMVKDVSAEKVGWDLTCTLGPRTARVEVKGVSGDRPVVLLTANEIRAAKGTDDWLVAVVTRAMTKPEVVEFAAADVVAAANPYMYKANLGHPDQSAQSGGGPLHR